MIPQIVYLILITIGIAISIREHGKTKTINCNATPIIIGTAIQILLLYFGGFFSCFVK